MRPNAPVVYAKRGAALLLALNFGKPTLRPRRSPRRLFDQFDKAAANDRSPVFAASFEFSAHHGVPSAFTARASLLAFHQRTSA